MLAIRTYQRYRDRLINAPRQRLRSALETAGLRIRRQLSTTSGGTPTGGPRGDDDGEQPLRAELFSVHQLEQHARSLAGWHDVSPRGRGPDRLLPRLAENEAVLRET